jgi:hypothetical protein
LRTVVPAQAEKERNAAHEDLLQVDVVRRKSFITVEVAEEVDGPGGRAAQRLKARPGHVRAERARPVQGGKV